MKARLLTRWNEHAAGTVLPNVQPGTGPGLIPIHCAEWYDDDEVVKPLTEKGAERKAAAVEDKGKK